MIPPSLIRAFFEQVVEKSSRSTILKPLAVGMSLSFGATIASFYLHLPLAVGILFMTVSALSSGLYLFAYAYCLFKDRESLRSERHSIQKLAIEKGFVGDSLQGIFDVKQVSGAKHQLSESSEKEAKL